MLFINLYFIIQQITGIKRPSPEPADVVAKTQKKPKAQKKKKKRDPNEPQKYASINYYK